MERSFRIVANELHYEIPGRITAASPLSLVGVFADDEHLIRLFARVYQLGRQDKATEIREVLGVKEPCP